MTLLKDNDYKEINVALLSLEADIKNKITNLDTSVIDRQLAEINSRIDKINAGGNNSSASINDVREEIEDINSKLNGNSAKIENIEQKLSDIFSAENKVTDFNTTTGSGIYYWADDAANRPIDYGVLLVNKLDGGSSTVNLWINQIAYGTNNKIYFRQNINSAGWTEWKAVAFDGEGKANFLDEYTGAGGPRPTSGNIIPKDATEYGGMRKDVVTSSMTDSGHPGQDGHLLTMFWDNSGRHDSQVFVSNEKQPTTVKVRVKANEADYGPWVDLITSQNIGGQTVAKASTAGTADIANNGTFGMLGGTKQAETNNFEDLLNNELCSNQTGGLRGGSIPIPAGQEAKNLGIPVDTWYNFLYIPHRTGIDSDNNMYGTLFVTPLLSNDGTFYIIHRISGHNYPAHRFNSVT